MANAPASKKPFSFSNSRRRVNRSLLLVLFTAVSPLALATLYMAAQTPQPGAWHSVVVVTVALGILGAWFMGNKLLRNLMDLLQGAVQSEQQLRKLMELSGDWYWQQDPNHVIARIIYRGKEQRDPSSPIRQLPFIGLARWDVPGLKCIDVRHNWDSFKQLLDQHRPFDHIAFEYWPEGANRIVFESTGRPIVDAQGHFSGYIGVSHDVTQKRLNEQLLSLQRSLLQGVLLSAPIAELAASYARGLKHCLTARAEVVLGYRERADIGPWKVRGSNKDIQVPAELGMQIWQNPEAYCDLLEGQEQHGLVWLGCLRPSHFEQQDWARGFGFTCVWLAMKRALEPGQPEYWIMVGQQGSPAPVHEDTVRVLTAIRLLGLCVERRVFEDDLQSLNGSLEQRIQQRTAELTRSNSELEAFTYTVSHDLRAPLRAIDGFSNILKEDFAEQIPEDARGLLDRISYNARQMGGLIDGLLDFSRLLRADVARVRVDQQQMLDQILQQLDATGKNIVHVPALPVVYADPVLLKQVWMNLIDNAIKFSSKTTQPEVRITHAQQGDFHTFSVSDNGAGFDMKYADKLFNVFERLHHKKDFDGTGVGLAIVKRIIERHGGQISAQGEPNKGACFTFTLPAQVQSAAPDFEQPTQ
ncbi:ATP-binding protein [Limnobacter sp.]|uniref:PAS domain-containing sensor histidine kinase n=1 Tax=Limnobacter sp. TaxID=2003368 RepID=UPI003518A6ED